MLLLFQAEAVTIPWGWVVGVAAPFLLAILSYFLYQKRYKADVDKTRSDIRKVDFDMMLAISDRAPVWMKQIEEMHVKNLDNETKLEGQEQTIKKLEAQNEIIQRDLDKAREGEVSCRELKTNVKVFLADIEQSIKKYPDSKSIIIEIHAWQRMLDN